MSSEAQRRANKKYRAANLKKVYLDVPISVYERWKDAADKLEMSLSGYCRSAIDEITDETLDGWQDLAE